MKGLEGSTILLTTHDDCHLSGRHVAATKKLVDFIIFLKKVKGDYYCFYYFKQGYTNTALF